MTDREVMQQVLDALEAAEFHAKRRIPDASIEVAVQPAIHALRTALEQQAVALKCGAIIEVFDKDWRMEYLSLPVGKHKLYTQQYIYTTPPQRPWVGLTDEEIHRTTVLLGFNPEWKTEIGVAHAIVRNLEAKLKERNND